MRKYLSTIIEEKLYLSDAESAGDESLLQSHGIRGIISLGTLDEHAGYHQYGNIEYYCIAIADHDNTPIHEHFEECINFINGIDGPVLVHCYAGMSRSPTIVMAYLMSEKKMEFLEAYMYVKTRRFIAIPNRGFMEQLKVFFS
jgi:protein-tyrosine phosphatase